MKGAGILTGKYLDFQKKVVRVSKRGNGNLGSKRVCRCSCTGVNGRRKYPGNV